MAKPPSPPRGNNPGGEEAGQSDSELFDPEAAPANPAGVLAAGAAPRSARTNWFAWGGARSGTSAEIVRLALPAMMSMTLASVAGIVDVYMVGRLGSAAQAAVGVSQQLFFIAQSALFALSFAGGALMSRAIGAGDAAASRRAFAASMVLALGVACLLFLLVGLHPGPLLRWLGADEEVTTMSIPYLRLVMGSTLLTGMALMVETALRSDKDTVTPMLVTVVITIVKITLNYVFIFGTPFGPVWGVTGAGVATFCAQLCALGLFIPIAIRKPRRAPTALRLNDFRGGAKLYATLIRIAAPSVLERLIMNLAMICYFKLIGGYGTAALAAYTVGIRILAFSWIPGVGYAQAVATLVGQALGAKNPAQAERAGWRAARLALLTALVMGALAAGFREPLAELFSVDPQAIAALGPFMLALAVAQPAMQLHFTLAGAFRGAGDTLTPLWSALFGNWVLRVPLAALCVWMEGPLGALWVVLIADHISRAAWMLLGFRGGRWKKNIG